MLKRKLLLTCSRLLIPILSIITVTSCHGCSKKTESSTVSSSHKVTSTDRTGVAPKSGYVHDETLRMGPLEIVIWIDKDQGLSPSGLGDRIIIVKHKKKEVLRLEEESSVVTFEEHSGKDINGDRNPELIINSWSGGARCCNSTTVYSIGATTKKILDVGSGSAKVSFKDLDHDGIMELITATGYETNTVCSFSETPYTTVVYQYGKGKGYMPASYRFPQLYEKENVENLAEVEQLVDEPNKIPDGETKCHILGTYANLMIAGQIDKAKEVLNKLYPFPDRDKFIPWAEQQVQKNPHFAMPKSQ